MPYPLPVAAPGIGLQLGPVLALANVMRSAGAWDGLDRRALTDLIGYHVEIMAGLAYPVLDRWLTLPFHRFAIKWRPRSVAPISICPTRVLRRVRRWQPSECCTTSRPTTA